MIRLFGYYVLKSIIALAVLEALIIVASFWVGAELRLYIGGIETSSIEANISQYFVFVGVIQTTMLVFGLYQRDTCRDGRQSMFTLFVVAIFSAILLATIFFLMPGLAVWRSMFVSGLVVAFGMLFLGRLFFLQFVDRERIRKKIVVLGAGKYAARIQHLDDKAHQTGFSCVRYYVVEGDACQVEGAEPIHMGEDLMSFCQENQVDEIVTAVDEPRANVPMQVLLDCKLAGINSVSYTTFLEREEGKVDVEAILPSWFVYSDAVAVGISRIFFKRMVDIVLSMLILAVSFPIILLAFIGIKITSKGPALFLQERVGLMGEPFILLKFRSMHVDAESDGIPRWAEEDDPRITSIGRVLRTLRIDELPQIYNVLRGDMSFVGPRPERPFFVESLAKEIPFYNQRHGVRPGITGWAQVKFSYGASVEDSREKLGYDLYYVRNATGFLDILVLIKTIRVVLFGSGAR